MTAIKQASTDLVRGFQEVSIASVADALWERGVSAHLSHEFRSVGPPRLAGPAVTVREEPTKERLPPEHVLDAIDTSAPGSVLVITMGDRNVALWGGLLTAGAVARELAGALLDGAVRDIDEIEHDFSFPVFARSFSPATTVGRYKTVALNEPVTIDQVRIYPGDIVVGGRDGVVIVPQADAAEILAAAQEIDQREREQSRLIAESRSLRKGLALYRRI